MAGVTDLAFRLLARECGADFTVTEFTAASGLSRADARSWCKVESDPRERPFIPQIFGGDAEEMAETVRLLSLKADIIDLNFGCPAPKVCRTRAGAAMLGDPDGLLAMVERCIESASVPISVKLRLGTGTQALTAKEIAVRLEAVGVMRIAVHGRTLSQRYSGVADWEAIRAIVDAVSIPVIANGDVIDASSAAACMEVTGAAGLMIGRGAIGRPEVFHNIALGLGFETMPPPWADGLASLPSESGEIERLATIKRWAWRRYRELEAETMQGRRNRNLKRHAISFTKGLPGSRAMRGELHSIGDESELADAVDVHLTGLIEGIPAI